jgi:hypothetical protein
MAKLFTIMAFLCVSFPLDALKLPNNPRIDVKSFQPSYSNMPQHIAAAVSSCFLLGILTLLPNPSYAIGSNYALRDQSMTIQDISFNVLDSERESDILQKLFQNQIHILRTSGIHNNANIHINTMMNY